MSKPTPSRLALVSVQGSSLVSVLVAIAIVGAVSVYLAGIVGFNAKTMIKVQERNDFEDARRWIGASVSCAKTKAMMGGACPGGAATEVALWATSSVIAPVGPGYKVFGKYQIHAKCTAGAPMTIDVELRKIAPPGAWTNLFTSIPLQC